MKKLLFIAVVTLVSCKKEATCIKCTNPSDVLEGCRGVEFHEQTDMAELVNMLQDNGYTCEIYYE